MKRPSLSEARLLAGTLRHARPVQVHGRLLAPLRRRVTAAALGGPSTAAHAPADAFRDGPAHDPWNEAEQMAAGRFRFLGHTADLGWPPDWRAPGESLLWRFYLHYHQYLHLLDRNRRAELLGDWVRSNPAGPGAAWHPYPISRRIVAWARHSELTPEVQESLYRQVAYLRRNLEWHVLGNHLLENARALIVAGHLFREEPAAREWTATGLRILGRETAEQILPDGGHFERSPMYHALVLELYLDVLACLDDGVPERAQIAAAARRMADFLVSLTHPDGAISLFNDATLEVAPHPSALLERCRRILDHEAERKARLPDSGYFVWSHDPVHLVVDGGPLGPEYLLAHAHADIFSYELSLHGQRFVVDTGVAGYEAGPMRDRVRGTAAHNTVSVDGVDQAEMWSGFRVARRYSPCSIEAVCDGGSFRFAGEFPGYAALIGDGILHRRQVRGDAREGILRVQDEVTGGGKHLVESRIHLHPSVTVTEAGPELRLVRDGCVVRLRPMKGEPSMEDSVYCPEFGVVQENRSVVLRSEGSLPAYLSYEILY